jgi:hypothetical protein
MNVIEIARLMKVSNSKLIIKVKLKILNLYIINNKYRKVVVELSLNHYNKCPDQ